MGTDQHAEKLREEVRRKYHLYVQLSTQLNIMGRGPLRVQLYQRVQQAACEWKGAQQRFLFHLRQHHNNRTNTYL